MSILKTLTDTTFDSVEGYRRAADKANSPALKAILTEQATKREALVTRMNAELERRGEPLVTKGTAAGKMHQLWVEVTNLFENGDEAATERVEEGEDYLAAKFEEALKMDDLDIDCRPIIEAAYREVKEGERLADMLEKQYD
ncbi:ferritin-like domain-containing protein [Sphingomicrobium arenosum]|uniref:ferritin-like domain-containing protein n=1 Tax=Sphingomicrobium arenosum TaxID=2233861 RepID=UPI00223EB462|nr:PA2169 family four-helix-bundle protein [Sphingomicrobium arenosum]